jgi:NADP-dependent aldehyde dehydrogenase
LSSVNPVVGFPGALGADGPDLAAKLAGSITLGSGQFCTSPGILLLLEHPASRTFLDLLADRLRLSPTHPMLTPGIREEFEQRVSHVTGDPHVSSRTGGASTGTGPLPTLVEVRAERFLRDAELREEVFGPYCVAITARDVTEMVAVLDATGGNLTTTIWADRTDSALARTVVEKALTTAGRVLFAGVPTGVAVTAAQQHGGPWPSSSRPDTTSVGLAAITRFMRPIALQDLPEGFDVLPAGLHDALARTP